MKTLFNKKAMTFTEALLVISLMSILTIAVFKSIINGLKIWEVSRQMVIEEDISLSLERVGQELRNTFQFSQIAFEGKGDEIRFASLVRVPTDPYLGRPNEYVQQIGRVEYYFNRDKKALFRRQANYGLALKEKYFPERVVAEALDSVRFFYYYADEEGALIEAEEGRGFPAGVKVEVGFKDNRGRSKRLIKFVYLPLGT